MDNFIFTEQQYLQLKNAYEHFMGISPETILSDISSLISLLEYNNFNLPLILQNKVLNNLSTAYEIISVVFNDKPTHQQIQMHHQNPFNLIKPLCQISINLTKYEFKSPYQIILLKANNFILKCIDIVCDYFSNKPLKTLKFM